MSSITLRVLDGADRGRIYRDLTAPITVGREEGNAIQLNDDRVSRFHLKIQEDNDRLVLTDLESTNGTRVNGEDIQLRILRHGDLIALGRSVLLFGSREEIAERLATLRDGDNDKVRGTATDEDAELVAKASSLDFELNWDRNDDLQQTLHVLQPPDLPNKMSTGQAAQLSELLEYLHIRIRRLIDTAKQVEGEDRISLSLRQWQNLVDLQSRLALYLRQIGEPDAEGD